MKLYLKKSVILDGKLYAPEAELDVPKKTADALIDDGAAVPLTEMVAAAKKASAKKPAAGADDDPGKKE